MPVYGIDAPVQPLNTQPVDTITPARNMASLTALNGQNKMIPQLMQAQALENQQRQQQIQQQGQMGPLTIQQQQQQNQQRDLELKSQAAMIDAWKDPTFTKSLTQGDGAYSSGMGFDPNAMTQGLVARGVLPSQAQGLVTYFQGLSQKNSEIRKNLGAAGADDLKNRAEAHTQLADDIADIMALPPEKQGAALSIMQSNYAKKPLPGLDPNDMAIFLKAYPAHLPAVAGALSLDGAIDKYHAAQAQKLGEAAKASQAVTNAAAPNQTQIQNATQTVNSYAAIPLDMRQSFAQELGAAPDFEALQKVQQRADAANESFQRSAEARQNAMALRDVGTQNLVAGKLVTEDQKLGSALDQTAGIRGLLNMSKGGNEAAAASAMTRFAEHEIVEGGVKRMNETEYNNLVGSLGTYGRKFQSWVDKGFDPKQMPPATNAELNTILDAEDKASNATHERSVGYIAHRYGGNQSSETKPPNAPAQTVKQSAPKIPQGATHKVPGPDGKMHYTNAQGTVDFGIAQ